MVKLLIILGLLRVTAGFQKIDEENQQIHDASNKDVVCQTFRKNQLYEVNCNKAEPRNIQCFFESNEEKFNQSLISLYIIYGKFSENKLPANWIKVNYQITELTFYNCYTLQEIEPFAFNSVSFQYIETLTFYNVQIKSLDYHSFIGLHSLKHLTIKNQMKLKAELILEPISQTLVSFKYQQTSEAKEMNLFNFLSTKSNMSNLKVLEYCVVRSEEIIYKDTFRHALNLKQIFLQNQGMEIQSGAFDCLAESLENLTITKKNIYIPDRLFDKVIERINFININAQYSECNCTLLYLAEVYQKYPNKFQEKNMKCFSTEHGTTKDIKIVMDSCSYKTTKSSIISTTTSFEKPLTISTTSMLDKITKSSIISTTTSFEKPLTISTTSMLDKTTKSSIISTRTSFEKPLTMSTTSMLEISSDQTTSRTTPVYKNLKKIDCNSNCSNCIDTISTKNILEIKEADIDFHLLSKDSNGVQIYLSEFIENLDVVWFTNDTIMQDRLELFYSEGNPTIQDVGCGLGLNCKTVTIDELQFNTTYTFCLIKRGENEISPFNCRSHYIGNSTPVPNIDDNHDDYLIPCDLELLTLILLSFGIVLAAVFGALATFCIIRRKPSLLKGSRRVFFIQKNDKRASSSMETRISSISTISNNRHSGQRRYSDSSIESGRSYVLPSNFYEVIQYKQRIDLEKKEKVYFDKFPTNSPPPLPKRCSK